MAKRRTVNCCSCGENEELVRIAVYDAWACKNCMTWIDPGCSDEKCCFCAKRPRTPENLTENDWTHPENVKGRK